MSATAPLYDLVLLLDSSADDDRRAEILKNAEDLIVSGGEVANKQDWGPRQLAYEISHKKDADYHLLQFHGTPELLAQLDRSLRILDEVVRFRIIKLAPGTPAPPETRAEPRPAAAGSEPAETTVEAPEPVAVAVAVETEAPAEADVEAPADEA